MPGHYHYDKNCDQVRLIRKVKMSYEEHEISKQHENKVTREKKVKSQKKM